MTSMPHAQYCRIESAAGGVGCSDREFIRAARALLNQPNKRSQRNARHEWLRDGLRQKRDALRLYMAVMGGNI